MEGVAILREQTKRFIDENPTDVVFTHNTPVSDGMGGHTTTPTPVPAQTVRIIQAVSAQSSERRTVSGEMTTPDMKVLAEWDADIEMGDTFEWRNLPVEVIWVVELPYEKTAEVAVR
jgi:hypothetical protein